MNQEKVISFIKMLYDKTIQDKIEWLINDTGFLYSTKDYSVVFDHISQQVMPPGGLCVEELVWEDLFHISIYDENGRAIDSYSLNEEPYNKALNDEELYNFWDKVKSIATGSEKAIDSLMDHLEKI